MKFSLKYLYVLLILSIVSSSCSSERSKHEGHHQSEKLRKSTRLTPETVEASAPYLTHDQENNPVLCWTEKRTEEEGYLLKYAVFNASTEAFNRAVSVLPSSGTRAHPESMNKIAFKEDGTVVALFAVKHPTEDNPFAGSIFYTLSADGGKGWSKAAYLHSDTLPQYGRGYFDLATLPNGEVGAVWLDGRFAEADTGSALFFSRTTKGMGFEKDWQIGESTCECCRTDLLVDQQGRLHVAYRDISFPASQMGKQIRDMAYSYSDDMGSTFTSAKPLSADNWAIEGCPHTGPSLTADARALHAVWFSAVGGPAVYYAKSVGRNSDFTPRQQLNKSARYPQITTLRNGARVIAWEEASTAASAHQAGHDSPLQHSAQHGQASGGSKIMLQLQRDDKPPTIIIVSDSEQDQNTHPVIIPLENEKVLLAWTQEKEGGKGIFYKVVDVGNIP